MASSVAAQRASLLSPPFELLSDFAGCRVSGLTQEPLIGGLTNSLSRLHLTTEDGGVHTWVLKSNGSSLKTAESLGLAREALFYSELAPRIRTAVPRALPASPLSVGDMATGEKLIVLEDITGGTDSGLCFGAGSPLNWMRGEAVARASAANSAESVALASFLIAARIHALYWRDVSLLKLPWLRCSSRGAGEYEFKVAQQQADTSWAATLRGEGQAAGMEWEPRLRECMTASFAKVSWPSYVASLDSIPFTLVSGDFHPGNVLVVPADAVAAAGDLAPLPRVVLLDFEAVGVGSGPQELGQYVISHMDPATRRGCEERLVRTYHAELLARGVAAAELPWEACWAEYKAGGAARWVWLLAYLSQLCPPAMTAFWAAQLAAFIADHGITPESIEQPRV